MPGLGQVYLGYYRRGFVHILVVGCVISFLAASGHHNPLVPLFGLFLAFFRLDHHRLDTVDGHDRLIEFLADLTIPPTNASEIEAFLETQFSIKSIA